MSMTRATDFPFRIMGL